jgi:hypothetical protein
VSNAIDALYKSPLPAGRQGALYNAFSYPTKISAESVAVFIACHTRPGDRVLDVFGGSGAAGIAAQLCERPTPSMLDIAESAGLSPEWGARNATIYELSEIGSLLGRVMTQAPEPGEFERAAVQLIATAEASEPDLYAVTDPDGSKGTIRHIIWSDLVSCPHCGAIATYANVRVRWEPLRFVDEHTCDTCETSAPAGTWERVLERRVDEWTGVCMTARARVPWRVYGRSGSKNWSRPATPVELG